MVDESDVKKVGEIKELICPVCRESISSGDFNTYFGACNNCVDNSGRIGT